MRRAVLCCAVRRAWRKRQDRRGMMLDLYAVGRDGDHPDDPFEDPFGGGGGLGGVGKSATNPAFDSGAQMYIVEPDQRL